LALDYLIGADGPQRGNESRITETPFGVGPAALGGSIAYCNLRRENGEPPEYDPYLPHDDIYEQYREGRPDPQGPGFRRNIVEQLDRCTQLGHTLVEEDNPDSYPLSAVMLGVTLAQERGLGVIAKNPGLLKDGALTYVAHPNVLGIIVEKDCGTPAEMDELRRNAGKPGLPVRFVSYGDGRDWATRTAQAIPSARYANMGVTYSSKGEYENSEDVLRPLAINDNAIPVTPQTKGTTMPDTVPPWLSTMREITGTHWAPGDDTNPTIIEWLHFVGSTYPKMADYCNSVVHDDYFSWCGLTVGYCMAKAGIAAVFGSSDTSRFLWAAAWLGWGTPVTTPQAGDVLVFDFGGGDHHVTLFERDNGNGTWSCLGGNQSHQVKLTNFPRSSLMGIRRPSAIGAIAQPEQPVPAPTRPASQRFADGVALVLKDEGGNDDDPRDPGGGTSRGILQREWDVWRRTHAGLPSDVWQAPQDQVLAIYHEKYWNPLCCDDLPAGVDYAVFDYGVNSGIGRAAKVLQGFVGADVDGEIGPKTIAATAGADAATLIKRICDERLAFLQGLATWGTFGRGWTNRVNGVRSHALAMVGTAAPAPTPTPAPTPAPTPTPAPAPTPTPAPTTDPALAGIEQRLERLEKMMTALVTTTPPAPVPAPTPPQIDLSSLLAQVMALIQAINAQSRAPQPVPTTPQQLQDQLRKIIDLLNALSGGASGQAATAAQGKLGPVNGALGQTIGNLLDGKKSAIGILGALVTAVLQSGGPAFPLSDITPLLASSAGLGSVAMPIFLALSAWGILGKMEKWTQASPPPAK
jgi:uncharacterized protein (TIGR02594 family)